MGGPVAAKESDGIRAAAALMLEVCMSDRCQLAWLRGGLACWSRCWLDIRDVSC